MNEQTNLDYDARVAQGAALLDQFLPGWVDKIDLDNLRFDSYANCVLGQLTYGSRVRAMTTPLASVRSAIDQMGITNLGPLYGFELRNDTSDNLDLQSLKFENAWRTLIEQRRAA